MNSRNSEHAPARPGGGSAPFAAIFDVDGTMVDNARYHETAWIELCRQRGRPITPDYYRRNMHARSNERIVRVLFGEACSSETVAAISRQKEELYREMFRPVIREVPGLTRLLQRLRERGVPCAAASNSPRENVDMVLDELRLRDCFAAVIDVDQVARGKPDPELFLTAAGRLGFPPERCIVFEDSASGFEAARRAGMTCIAIAGGSTAEDREQTASVRAVFSDFRCVDVESLLPLLMSEIAGPHGALRQGG